MKPILLSLLTMTLLCFITLESYAVVGVKQSSSIKKVDKPRNATKLNKRTLKKQKRLDKKIKRLQKRASKGKGPAIDSSIIDDARFRLGAIVFLAGLAFLLLSALFIGFGGFIIWVGRLAVLIGLVLMVWALIENS